MEEKKTFFDYIAQVFLIFGCTILILTVFCLLFGQSASPYSSIFRLGSQGISCGTMLQFLVLSAIITLLRFLFFTDTVFKRMSVVLRTVCMVAAVILLIAAFSYAFSWFPIDSWRPWVSFFISFFVCFAASTFLTFLKVRAENKALEKALKKIQEDHNE